MIDFHVHTFPKHIAGRALDQLSKSADAIYYLDGTLDAMASSMREAGITESVLLPVATHSRQTNTINRIAIQINDRRLYTGIHSFGAIHPDNENYREILRELAANNIRGIKLHPVFQGTDFDDIRYLRILDCACELQLAVTVHAGYDISFPGQRQAAPERILAVINKIRPEKLILAHMGGWNCWDQVEECLAGQNVYFDTSFCLTPIRHRNHTVHPQMGEEQFRRLVKRHGADRILFGSDSPWSSQKEAADALRATSLTPGELSLIFDENAKKLLCV